MVDCDNPVIATECEATDSARLPTVFQVESGVAVAPHSTKLSELVVVVQVIVALVCPGAPAETDEIAGALVVVKV